MSALFWDPDYSSPPKTPPLHFARSEFRYTSSMSFYDQSQCISPIQDNRNNVDWTSSEQVQCTRLNPSRTRDSTGEWHMVTATRSLLGSEREGQRESLQARGNLSYNSLPRAHFLQPNRESSAFSPYTKDIWLDGKDALNIAGSPRNSPKLHQRTQPGFYSPKTSRSKHCDATQSTKNALKGSSTSNVKEFSAHTLPLPCSKTGLLKLSKPQKVKTSVVETPPLMRAVISQTSDQPSEKLREDHHAKNEDQSLSRLQEPNTKQCGNDPFMWSRSQPGRYQDLLSAKDHLSINTHLFPERQSAVLSQKAIQERFSLSVDSGIKPCQGDPDQPEPCQPHANLIQPDCSQRQDAIHHHEDSDVRNGYKSESQVDMISKNVFGQPRMTASLRAACSPRAARKSTVLEDLKKLIVMDDTEDGPRDDSLPIRQKEAELCASPLSSSHATQSYPALAPSHLSMQTRPTECWPMPEQAESDPWEQDQDFSELMPLLNTACHLDWDSLVQAAQAYETQRMATLLSEMSPVSSRPETPSQGTYKIHHSNAYHAGEDAYDDVFIDFPDQLSHLEAMLKRLSGDLLKEKRDKVALLAEVLKLRISNQHLREESLCAVEQLHKISSILNATPEGVESNPELEDYRTTNPNM